MKSTLDFRRYVTAAIVAVLLLVQMAPAAVEAAKLTPVSVRLGRLAANASTGNDVFVSFTLASTPTTVAKVKITFPSGFTLTTGTPTPVTTNAPLTPSTTAFPGTLSSSVTGAGAGAGGTIVVSTTGSASLVSGTRYQFTIPTGSVANPSSASQYVLAIESETSAGAAIDTNTAPVYITTASPTSDQIGITASVAPSFKFSLSGASDTVPSVDPTTIQTSAGVTMQVITNSPLGYTAYVKSAGSLTSASTSTPIPTGTFDASPDTITAGTSRYGFVPSTTTPAAATFSGSLTYDAEYAVGDGTHAGSFNGTNFASFISRNGYTDQDNILLKERVAVSSTIGYANNYTDTLTIIAAGNY